MVLTTILKMRGIIRKLNDCSDKYRTVSYPEFIMEIKLMISKVIHLIIQSFIINTILNNYYCIHM